MWEQSNLLPQEVGNIMNRRLRNIEFWTLIVLAFIALGSGVLEQFLHNSDRGTAFIALALALLANARTSQIEGDIDNKRR
jgi:hypothetical protein